MKGFRPPRPTGSDKEARYHQAVWDRVFGSESKLNSTSTVTVDETSKGFFFHAAAARGGSAPASVSLTLFQVDSDAGEYLACKRVTFNTGGTATPTGETINVAKPFYLRSPPFGDAVTHPPYTASTDAPYSNGTQYIFAVENSDGGTGIFVDGAEITWIDLNCDARSWAYVTHVCVDGEEKLQNFVASEPYDEE